MNKLLHPIAVSVLAIVLGACGGGSDSSPTNAQDTTVPRDQQVDTPDTTGGDNDTGGNTNTGTGDDTNGTGDDNTTGTPPADNNTGTGGNDTPPEEEEEPSLGESFYGFLCVSCHGIDGTGTDNGPSLIKLWDPLALQNKIAADMPPNDPIACSGLCAQTTSAYIAEAFKPVDPDDDTPPTPPPAPFALIHSDDDLTNFVPHSIALEARFTGIAGTPLIQWYLDEQLVAEGINYNVEFVVPSRHQLQLVITGQDNVQVVVNEEISIMAEDHAVDECSPPIEYYAVNVGPNIVDADCVACHRDNGPAASSGLHFERLTVRGALTTNYNALGRYADTPNALLTIVGGNGHDAGERLNLGDTNSQLYQYLSTFLSIEAETPAACLDE